MLCPYIPPGAHWRQSGMRCVPKDLESPFYISVPSPGHVIFWAIFYWCLQLSLAAMASFQNLCCCFSFMSIHKALLGTTHLDFPVQSPSWHDSTVFLGVKRKKKTLSKHFYHRNCCIVPQKTRLHGVYWDWPPISPGHTITVMVFLTAQWIVEDA